MINKKEPTAAQKKQILLTRVIRNHASYLCNEHHISRKGNHLCRILGHITAQDNEEAIAGWLKSEYPTDPAEVTKYLINDLESSFVRIVA